MNISRMELDRYVIVTIKSQRLYLDFLKYVKDKHGKYSWAVRVLNRNNDDYEVFIWWRYVKSFSATPLRSALKRLKDKYKDTDGECFTISKAMKTKGILSKFPNILADGLFPRPTFHLSDDLICKLQDYKFVLGNDPPPAPPPTPTVYNEILVQKKKKPIKKKVSFEEEECESSVYEESETESELHDWNMHQDISSIHENIEKLSQKMDSTMKTIIRLIGIVRLLPKYMGEKKDVGLQTGEEEPMSYEPLPKLKKTEEEINVRIERELRREQGEDVPFPVTDGNPSEHPSCCCCETCWADPIRRRCFF